MYGMVCHAIHELSGYNPYSWHYILLTHTRFQLDVRETREVAFQETSSTDRLGALTPALFSYIAFKYARTAFGLRQCI